MKFKVLIIDDNPDIANVLYQMVTRLKHIAVTYTDPNDLPMFKEECKCKPDEICADALLIDVMNKDMDGFQILKTIVDKGCKVRIVFFISGYPQTQFTKELESIPKDIEYYFLEKPVGFKELIDIIKLLEVKVDKHRKLSKGCDEIQ